MFIFGKRFSRLNLFEQVKSKRKKLEIMMKIGFIIVFSFLSLAVFSQTGGPDKIDLSKLPDIRSNSRDIVPVRRSNIHQSADFVKQKRTVDNSKRAEYRMKRAQFKNKKMMMNKQRLLKMQRMMQQKAINRRRR